MTQALRAAALATGSALSTAVSSRAWATGSDAPEKKEVRIGFIPLTDCASVVMASLLKFDEKYGIKIIPTKEASWDGKEPAKYADSFKIHAAPAAAA